MITRAVLLKYRDGDSLDMIKGMHLIDLVSNGPPPKRIETFPSKPYYLLEDRSRLAHRHLFDHFGAVYLFDHDAGKNQYH